MTRWAHLCHLHRDWAHPCHIGPGTALTPSTSAPGPGSPLPHRPRDWAHTYHIGPGTELTPATSAPGQGLCAATAAADTPKDCAFRPVQRNAVLRHASSRQAIENRRIHHSLEAIVRRQPSMRHAIDNERRATCNMYHATDNARHADNMRTACGMTRGNAGSGQSGRRAHTGTPRINTSHGVQLRRSAL